MKFYGHYETNLPAYLHRIQDEIEDYARQFGLDFYKIVYEILSYKEMNAIAAYGGFPVRYPHWRYGMEYERLSKGHVYGLQTIYEMVINNDPCYAYLLEGNSLIDQKMVMAHVAAHCDFFKNNVWFSHTNRNMMNEMANHASRIRSYIDKYGIEKVETFVDICLSIDNLIDIHSLQIKRKHDIQTEDNNHQEDSKIPGRFPTQKQYLEHFINPPSVLKAEKEKQDKEKVRIQKFPFEPERDVMQFLLENAPLKPWQQNILAMIREESYYYVPQAQTKIMNEGWATYWHSKIMTEKVLNGSEVIDYADRASRVTASSGPYLNPYKLGVQLYYDIEERWNKGQFGKEWDECENLCKKRNWDQRVGLGLEKIFEVRNFYNDLTFIDEFLTLEFAVEQKLFTFGYSEKRKRWEIESRNFYEVKNKLISQLVNNGNPNIYVEDANLDNKGELLLSHEYYGIDLRQDWARDTLTNIFNIWTRPVNLLTQLENKKVMLRYDGKEHTQKKL